MRFNPDTDLQMVREVALDADAIWRAWTTPALLMQWFCPRPWKVSACDIDLRPGGIFRTVMQAPTGQNMPDMLGTYLSVEPARRLVWTNLLGPGFRPQAPLASDHPGFGFVVDLGLHALPGGGTRYSATVMHPDAAAQQVHAALGFAQGWSLALDQLLELMKT